MGLDRNTTLTHVYGVFAAVIGVVGGVSLFTEAATWRDYLLYGSGWVSAVILGILLSRSSEQARNDGIELGALRAELETLRKTLDQRSALLDYLGAQLLGARATPRMLPSEEAEDE